MKKTTFFVLIFLVLASAFLRHGSLVIGFGLAWLVFLLLAHRQRTKPRFLAGNAAGRAFQEYPFVLAEHLFALLPSSQGGQTLVVTRDGKARRLDPSASVLQESSLESKPLALLLSQDGRLYLAMEKEILGLDAQGKPFGRLGFQPPELGAQAYKLHLSTDGSTLCLQTPWFVQWMKPDLSGLGHRLSSQEVGNYIKYFELAPDGSFAFLGGALLLEEYVGVQARYACWARQPDGTYSLAWQKEDDSQDNSHIRALNLSADGSRLLALVHRSGYQFQIYDREGKEVWRRRGEDPVLSPDGGLVLWNNPFEGLTLTELAGEKKKLWTRRPQAQVRLKHLDAQGRSLVLEGRHLLLLGRDGSVLSEDWFATDPHDLALSEDGSLLAVVRQLHGALIQVSGSGRSHP
jgi:hypothetical protein